MIKKNVDLTPFLPITRGKAAEIASIAGKFESMLTLERDGIVLNMKSMIGLLSQSVPKDGQMMLVASGIDEAQAATAVAEALEG